MNIAAVTLEELIAPLTDAEFSSLLRARKLTLLRGTKGDGFASLLGWQALKGMISRGEYSHGRDHVRVTKESAPISPDRWMSKGKIDTAKLEEYLAKGFSVIVTHIEPHVRPLTAICDDVKSRLREGSYVGVIVTAGTADGAFKIHYDPEDLIILQIEGTKRWQIFGPAVSLPVRGMAKQSPPDTAPIFDEVLEPGDFLFVPGGNWHHCENGLSTSVHLGFFFIPPTGWHAVQELTSELLAEEMFRLPLTRVEDEADLAALESKVKSRLIEKIGQLSFKEFLADWNKKAY